MLAFLVFLFALIVAPLAIGVFAVLVVVAGVLQLISLVLTNSHIFCKAIFRWIAFWLTLFLLTLRGLFRVIRNIVHGTAFVIERLIRIASEPILVREREQQPSPSAENRFSRLSTVRALTWSWFAPTCVLGVFLALSGTLPDKWRHLLAMDQLSVTSRRSEGASSLHRHASLALPGNETGIGRSEAEATRPQWIVDGATTSGDVRRIVAASQLWSTVEEAKTELLSNAQAIVDDDFEQRHHGLLDPKRCQIPDDRDLERVVVKERYVDQVDMDFGTMYRLYWLIEVSPIVRTELYPYWKAAKVQNRIIAVGLVIALLTMTASASVLCDSLKRASKFSPRRPLAATASCVAAWSLLSVLIATQLLS